MWKKISAIVVPTVIAVGIIAYMLIRVWDDLLVALENAAPAYLVIAVLVCTAGWWLRGVRYQYILRRLSVSITLVLSTACILVSQTANLIVPARLGDLVRLFILKHEVDATYSRGLSSVVIERVFDVVMIAILGLFALPFVLDVPDWFFQVILIPIVLGAVFVLILLLGGRIRSRNRYLRMVLDLIDEMKEASLNATALLVLSASSIAIWLSDIIVCLVIAWMFGQAIPVAVVVLAIVIGNLVKAIPITPGGVGTYELSVAITLELAGISPALATLIAVIDHLVKNLVTLAGGVIAVYFFGDWAVTLLKRVFSKSLSREELREP
jgi:uncharacterized protein (TIRG00374 family)